MYTPTLKRHPASASRCSRRPDAQSLAPCGTEAAYRRRSSLHCFLAGGTGDHDNARAIAASWHEAEADQRAARDRADRIARVLVRSPKSWTAVQAVAAALLGRGRIDGDEVDALCSAAYGAPFAYDRWAEAWPPSPAQIRGGFLPAERQRAA